MDLVQAARDEACALTRAAYAAAVQNGRLPCRRELPVTAAQTKDEAHGDWTTPFALAAAGALGLPACEIAACLLRHIDLTGSYFRAAAVAAPGHLNFTLGDRWYAAVLADIECACQSQGGVPDVPQDSEHPLYRLMYAHARIGTLLALRAEQGTDVPRAAEVDAALLCAGHERDLMKTLAARGGAPAARYLAALADRFFAFYHATGLRGNTPAQLAARLKLAACTGAVIRQCSQNFDALFGSAGGKTTSVDS